MFERFTSDAREVVVGAQDEARRLRHGRVGTEHLLLALLAREGSTSAAVLGRYGLTHDSVADAVGPGALDRGSGRGGGPADLRRDLTATLRS